jgi:hypothetical protein
LEIRKLYIIIFLIALIAFPEKQEGLTTPRRKLRQSGLSSSYFSPKAKQLKKLYVFLLSLINLFKY